MKKWTLWIVVTISAIIIYHVCYSLTTLYPPNIKWLMSARHDWGTHYLGWAFFKNEPWHFPIGKVLSYNYPVGTNVGFTDSIPLFALFFKLFARWLPADFQYYGIWLFICHLLAAYYTLRLCGLFKVNAIISIAASIFVATSPVLVFRAIHPALCAHWLLIACVYLYFLDPKVVNPKKILVYQLILLIISAMINPYLCWMVLGFTLCTPVKLSLFDKEMKKKYLLGYIPLSLILLISIWYVIGMIEFGQKEDLSVGGSYGLYALNLNSLVNSSGYSRLLPQLKQVSPHQYEGYMYLGLGMLLLLFVLALIYSYSFAKQINDWRKRTGVETTVNRKKLIPLLVLVALYVIFSVTLVITLNDKILFKIPAPSLFVRLIEIFRANSRFFWMPYYLIIIFTIIGLGKSKLNPLISSAIIVGALLIQLYDIKPLLTSRRDPTCCAYAPPMANETWIKLMGQFDEVLFFPAFTSPGIQAMDYQDFSYLAMKAGKPVNLAYVARADLRAMQLYSDRIAASLDSGKLSPKALYITNISKLEHFSLALQMNGDRLNLLDNCFYIYSKSKESASLDEIVQNGNKVEKERLDSVRKAFAFRREFLRTDGIPNTNTSSIRYNAESIQTGSEYLSMKGWAFIDSTQNNKGDSIFVTLSSSDKSYVASAKITVRGDMATFGRKYLDDAGFVFLAFTDSVQKGIYQVGILIKNAQGRFAYQPLGKELKVKFADYASPEKTNRPISTGKINYDMQVDDNESEISASGWAAIENQDVDQCHIFLVLKSNTTTYLCAAQLGLRPDVSAYYKNKYRLDSSGYSTKILKSSLEKNKYKLGILIKDRKRNAATAVFTSKEIIVD